MILLNQMKNCRILHVAAGNPERVEAGNRIARTSAVPNGVWERGKGTASCARGTSPSRTRATSSPGHPDMNTPQILSAIAGNPERVASLQPRVGAGTHATRLPWVGHPSGSNPVGV